MRSTLARLGAGTATAVAALALTAACSSSSSPAAGSAPSSGAAAPTTAASSAGAAGITTANAPGLGTIVVGSTGHPVYRYDLDKNNPPTSNCSGGCLQAWPPVPATTQVTGIPSSLIGSVTATNGTKQLTIAGWPVYYYAADTGPGQTAGEGVGGVWWAVGPDGSEVKSSGSGGGAASSSSSSSGGSSGGSIGGY